MNAPVHHSEIRLDALEVFELRCWARAYLWAACELDLHEAVDVLQADAVKNWLVDEVGQDEVQQLLAAAFHDVREEGGR